MAIKVEPDGSSARINGIEVWIDPPPQDASCWLLFALPYAFLLQQPIEVTQPIDDWLLEGADIVQRIWAGWYKKAPVSITAKTRRSPRNRQRAAFFTGGVDSFFTAVRRDVDDLLFVNGFDISLDQPEFAESVRKQLAEAAGKLGKRLVTVSTNVRRDLYGKHGWGTLQHGPALAGVAACLGYEKTFAGSTHWLGDVALPWGSHPYADGYLGLCHDGAGYSRAQKTAFLAKHPVAMEYLRVCYSSRSAYNCSECPKCLRTMTALHMLRVYPPTFDWSKFRLRDVARTYLPDENDAAFFAELLQLPGDRAARWAVRASLAYSSVRRLFQWHGSADPLALAALHALQPAQDAGGQQRHCGQAQRSH